MINFADAGTWVAISFFIFLGILIYFKVPKTITKALDDRADTIKKELDEARQLREEAQAVLADYQRKVREAETEAANIIDQAKSEADAYAKQTRQSLKETLERRLSAAEDRIAQAKKEATDEVRSAAVDAAINASTKLLEKNATGKIGTDLIEQSIKGLKSQLN